MGSKHRLWPWLHDVLSGIEFDSVLDAFSGSGCVAYLLKAMGKRVTASDRLHFAVVIARAAVENSSEILGAEDVARLLEHDPRHPRFIERTFRGIFFSGDDLRFLDRVWARLDRVDGWHRRDIALSALIRSCVKRQPRGVFTVAGDPERYKDGRRDLRLSLRDHFLEQVEVYNRAVFSTGRRHRVVEGDVFEIDPAGHDLVYLDPPYVPRADDNCYIKRYHFLEGLSRYWEGCEILVHSRVRKIVKPHTPFSHRSECLDAFRRLFERFCGSIIVLSYSSNGYPDIETLTGILRSFKPRVDVFERDHRYHFGTHRAVRRAKVREYLIVGR
ncbi:MAG: DNA adenine methylase [Planctomycetes bacterium]|nr:DNA adenine methylase [Planctomycetota bacterium]